MLVKRSYFVCVVQHRSIRDHASLGTYDAIRRPPIGLFPTRGEYDYLRSTTPLGYEMYESFNVTISLAMAHLEKSPWLRDFGLDDLRELVKIPATTSHHRSPPKSHSVSIYSLAHIKTQYCFRDFD